MQTIDNGKKRGKPEVTKVFQNFVIDIVTKSTAKFESQRVKQTEGSSVSGSHGFGLCMVQGLDEQLIF